MKIRAERAEGTTYKSNSGITDNSNSNISADLSTDIYHNESCGELTPELVKIKNDIVLIYYDPETSGLRLSADILQIAAKAGKYQFSVYVTPTQNIDADASAQTKLTNIGEKLYYKGVLVENISLQRAMIAFYEFLAIFNHKCLLIAHNGKAFDPRLVRAFQTHGILDMFEKVIHGFSDSLPMFKALYPDRKGPEMFKLGTLAKDLLRITGNLHEATFEVAILEKLCNNFMLIDKIFTNSVIFADTLHKELNKQNVASKLPDLAIFKRITSITV